MTGPPPSEECRTTGNITDSSGPMCRYKMNRIRVRVQEAISRMEDERSHELHNCYPNCELKNPAEQCIRPTCLIFTF